MGLDLTFEANEFYALASEASSHFTISGKRLVNPGFDIGSPEVAGRKFLVTVRDVDTILPELVDITAPEGVELSIREDGQVIWVNVDGVCRLRCCQIKHLEIEDKRLLTAHGTPIPSWLPADNPPLDNEIVIGRGKDGQYHFVQYSSARDTWFFSNHNSTGPDLMNGVIIKWMRIPD